MTDKDIEVHADFREEVDEEMKTPLEEFFYHQRKALEESRKAMEHLLPPEFREHSREAGREFAKGFKVLVDAAIDELKKVSEHADADQKAEKTESEPAPSTTGKTKVKVQVE